MSVGNGTKRKRHVPVRGVSHIYFSETKRGKVFEVRHPRNADGRRLFEVVGTRLDAAKARAREVHGSSGPAVSSVGLTLRDVVEDWRKTREMRPSTVASFDVNLNKHILPVLGRRKVRDINQSVILAWLAGLKRADKKGSLSDGTRRLILKTLLVVLAHAVEMGALSAVPRVPRKRVPKAGESRQRVLSPDEEARLLAYAGGFPWIRPIVVVALHQALRLGEVLGLQWEDVDFVGGVLHVRHSLGRDGTLGLPKGGKEASIPLTSLAREALLELRGASNGTGFVFRNKLGHTRRHHDVQRAFGKARDRAALTDGVVFHSLRHTGISRLANHPAIPLVHVRDFARHSSLSTTQMYVHKIEDVVITEAISAALAA